MADIPDQYVPQECEVSSPLDEDAPALARIAAQAVSVLNDATAASVDYPG